MARELRATELSRKGKTRLERLKRLAPYFLIGPISGPLVAGVVFNLRGGRPVLAGLYALLLIQYVVLLPALVAKLGLNAL